MVGGGVAAGSTIYITTSSATMLSAGSRSGEQPENQVRQIGQHKD